MKKALLILLCIVGVGVIGVLIVASVLKGNRRIPSVAESNGQTTQTSTNGTSPRNNQDSAEPVTIAENLRVPWEIVFLPNGNMLITERPGNVRLVGQTSKTFKIEGVTETSEGGLLGMALHPKFEENQFVYLYKTVSMGKGVENKVERYRFSEADGFTDRVVIIDHIPGASNHDGGRIAFGPDGYLYITTGDAAREQLAQDKTSLAGKILRVDEDGKPTSDNPFGNEVYSYGHRNPQGLAWDSKGQLWATEHGPSARDELNRVEKGKNYGWPTITGDGSRRGMERPVAHSGTDTWAPSGLAIVDDVAYFAGLRGRALFSARLTDAKVVPQAHLKGEYGRIRIVRERDGLLYFSTSNRDGRGVPQKGSDFVIRIAPGAVR